MATYCFNFAAILPVSVMHSSSRVISKRKLRTRKHIRKTRRMALLCIPILWYSCHLWKLIYSSSFSMPGQIVSFHVVNQERNPRKPPFVLSKKVLPRENNETLHQKERAQFHRKPRNHEGKVDCHLPLRVFQ